MLSQSPLSLLLGQLQLRHDQLHVLLADADLGQLPLPGQLLQLLLVLLLPDGDDGVLQLVTGGENFFVLRIVRN